MYTDYTDDVEDSESYYSDEGDNNNIDKEKIKKIIIGVIVFVVLVILIIVLAKSCSKSPSDEVGNNVDNSITPSIVVSRETLTLKVGEEQSIEAVVITDNNNSTLINWLSEDSSIAMVDDLGGGKGTVIGVKEGTTNIIATYRASNGNTYTNKCIVTVTSTVKKLEAINIAQESMNILKGDSILLQISTTPADARADDLVFTSDNKLIATVDEIGYVKGVGVGTTTITVKTSDGSLSDSVIVIVSESGSTVINPTNLIIKGLSNGLSVGKTAKIDYEIYPSNATNKVITWSSSNPNIATVNSSGVVTGISPGNCTIIGSTSNNVSARLEISVQSNTVAVSSITNNLGSSITMNINGTRLLSYTISPSNATNKEVVYTTSDSSVVFVNQLGVMLAQKVGTATVTVTTRDGNKSTSVKVTVIDPYGGNSGSTSSGSTGSTPPPSSGGTSSSGGSSSSGSSGGSSSSGGSQSVSCNSSSITWIEHNGSSNGAVISSISFANAEAFTGTTTPAITFTDIASCLDQNSVTYAVYYGSSSSNVGTVAARGSLYKGAKIQLNKGNYYYRIEVTGKVANQQVTIKKNYYAIVKLTSNTSSSSDTLKPTFGYLTAKRTSYGSTSVKVSFSIKEIGSGLSKVLFCVTTSNQCTPYIYLKTFSPPPTGSSLNYSDVQLPKSISTTDKKVCLRAYDAANNYNDLCTPINDK